MGWYNCGERFPLDTNSNSAFLFANRSTLKICRSMTSFLVITSMQKRSSFFLKQFSIDDCMKKTR